MGGPLDGGLDAWWPIYLLGAVVLVVLVAASGALAGALGGRRSAFVLGAVAYAASAWWLRVRWGVEGEAALLWGFGASALVGGLVRGAGRLDADRRRFALAGVGITVAALSAVAVTTTEAHERSAEAEAALRPEAETVAVALRQSDARTTIDLALDSTGDVVEASGRRDDGGVDLVVRTTQRSFGKPTLTACWQYRVEGERVDGPDPTSCPGGAAPELAADVAGPLAADVLALPAEDQRHADTVRPVVEAAVERIVVSGDQPTVEVDAIEGDAIGVAIQLSLTTCAFVRIGPVGPNAEYTWWRADPEKLRSGTPGCHPEGAVP